MHFKTYTALSCFCFNMQQCKKILVKSLCWLYYWEEANAINVPAGIWGLFNGVRLGDPVVSTLTLMQKNTDWQQELSSTSQAHKC